MSSFPASLPSAFVGAFQCLRHRLLVPSCPPGWSSSFCARASLTTILGLLARDFFCSSSLASLRSVVSRSLASFFNHSHRSFGRPSPPVASCASARPLTPSFVRPRRASLRTRGNISTPRRPVVSGLALLPWSCCGVQCGSVSDLAGPFRR